MNFATYKSSQRHGRVELPQVIDDNPLDELVKLIKKPLIKERKLTRVNVWNEGRHEKSNADVAKVYLNGIHTAIGEGLKEAGFSERTATLDDPEHGLTAEVLAETDVLTWWGHMAHVEVKDEIVERVHQRVLEGMGLIVLHSRQMGRSGSWI